MVYANSFIIGVNKAGTTSLFTALARLDSVCPSRKKETQYFSPIRYGRPLAPIEEYAEQFSRHRSEPIVLEASPDYFYGGASIAYAIRSITPTARAVVVLRDPRTRAYSWYKFAKTRNLLTADVTFDEYVARCVELGHGPESDPHMVGWRGLTGGRYEWWLGDWRRVLGEDLLVVFYEDLAADGDRVLGEVASHFGHHGDAGNLGVENVSRSVRHGGLQRVALRINNVGETFWRRAPRLKEALRTMYYQINGDARRDYMSAGAQSAMEGYFSPTLRELKCAGLVLPPSWQQSR